MKPRSWIILGVVLLAVVLLVATRGRDGGLRYYAPEGYVARANTFISKGLLQFNARTGQIDANLSGASSTDKEWYANSFLSEDVALFNDPAGNYKWYFTFDRSNKLIGVDPLVHRVPLPFASGQRWTGKVQVQSKERGASLLSSNGRVLTVTAPQGTARVKSLVNVELGQTNAVTGSRLRVHSATGPNDPLARMFMVGDELVLQNRVKAGRNVNSLRLQGYPVPNGGIARIEHGDWIYLESLGRGDQRETLLYLPGDELDVVSRWVPSGTGGSRATTGNQLGWFRDPRERQPMGWVDVFTGRIDSLVAQDSDQGKDADFDIALTIQRDLQASLSNIVRNYETPEADSRAVEMGITVMDGRNGKLLAMASHPTPEQLDSTTIGGARRSRLLLNQNLVRHPVGSATKPFFFAAVADQYPAMMDLVIPGHASTDDQEELFHCRLDKGYRDPYDHYGEVDFVRAIQDSCNRYTTELLTLSLALDRNSAGRRRIGNLREAFGVDSRVSWSPRADQTATLAGRPINFAPDFSRNIEVALGTDAESGEPYNQCSSITDVDQLAFVPRFETITGALSYRGQVEGDLMVPEYLSMAYDLSAFSPLLRHFNADQADDRGWAVRSLLQPLAPERVNLALNDVTLLRGEFISMLLGGSSGLWTNVQLAEALSRLVTDRPVQAQLIEDVKQDDKLLQVSDEVDNTSIFTHAEARQKVLQGMSRVISAGTGDPLAASIRPLQKRFPDSTIYAFAKTGSSNVERADQQIELGATLILSVVKVKGRSKGIPTPAELAREDTRILSIAMHVQANEPSRAAIRLALEVMPLLAEYLE